MKRGISIAGALILGVGLWAMPAAARTVIIKAGMPACTSKEALTEFMMSLGRKDLEASAQLVMDGTCTITGKRAKGNLLDRSITSSYVKVRLYVIDAPS